MCHPRTSFSSGKIALVFVLPDVVVVARHTFQRQCYCSHPNGCWESETHSCFVWFLWCIFPFWATWPLAVAMFSPQMCHWCEGKDEQHNDNPPFQGPSVIWFRHVSNGPLHVTEWLGPIFNAVWSQNTNRSLGGGSLSHAIHAVIKINSIMIESSYLSFYHCSYNHNHHVCDHHHRPFPIHAEAHSFILHVCLCGDIGHLWMLLCG